MILIDLLYGLSYTGGVKLLLEEGYIEEDCIEKDDASCDKQFLYPFSSYQNGELIDRIYHVECCVLEEDGEYEAVKTYWSRQGPQRTTMVN